MKHLSIHPPMYYLCIHLSVYSSIYLGIYLSIYLSICWKGSDLLYLLLALYSPHTLVLCSTHSTIAHQSPIYFARCRPRRQADFKVQRPSTRDACHYS